MKKIFFSICMLAAMSSVVLTSCKDEDVAGTPAPAVVPTPISTTNAGVTTAAVAAATAGAIQTAGTTTAAATDGSSNQITTTVSEVETLASGAQQQVVTVVTKDENNAILNTVETTTTVEASTTNEPGAKTTQVEVTKDADGNQIGEAKTTVTDYTYTYTVAGKTYNTTAELQAALQALPAGTVATVTTTLTKITTVNGEETAKEKSTAETKVNIPEAGKTLNETLNIPATIEKQENSEIATATQEVTLGLTKPEKEEPQHNGGETND